MDIRRHRPLPSRLALSLPLIVVAGSLTMGACELEEVSVAVPEDVLVAEAFLMVGDDVDEVTAFLHWTLGTRPARDLLDAEVFVLTDAGEEIHLLAGAPSDCVFPRGEEETEGVCFSAGADAEDVFQAGTHAELVVRLGDGRELRGGTEIPLAIEFIQPAVSYVCALPPGRNIEFRWSRSPGAWAYTAETEITGLRDALAVQGIQVEADSVALLGLAVSETDTTIVFPREFGVFDRFALDQEIAVALQEGLPEGAAATVAVGAVDRNYVNWVRGGNFYPSGTFRVSSLRGDGIGVFGSVVRRVVLVVGRNPGSFFQSCFSGS